MGSMAAVVHYALREGSVELREVPQPEPPGDAEVVLKTEAVGICGSEIHQFHNLQSWPVNVPVILGHEFSGIVAQVGRGVSAFREGDRVASETAARICGECAYCRSGEYNLCPKRLGFGYGVDGAMADYVRVPARCLHHLPASVPPERAALAEPCCVAYNAVAVKTRVEPEQACWCSVPGPSVCSAWRWPSSRAPVGWRWPGSSRTGPAWNWPAAWAPIGFSPTDATLSWTAPTRR